MPAQPEAPMSEYLRLARLYLVLLAIFTVGRWLMGTSGVPYDKGHHVFSLIILTTFSILFYGAFCRRWLGYRLAQAALLGFILAMAAQIVIVVATVLSYGLGLETYFNNPRALNVEAPLSFGQALGRRLGALVGNPLFGALMGCIGWALGGLLPVGPSAAPVRPTDTAP
jgi:hypothetical protein